MNKQNTSALAVTDLNKYREQNYNVLVPTTHMQQISPFHKMRVEEVRINPDPDAGDVFKVGSRKVGNKWEDVLSPAKPAIMKLANAAGIIWNWNETKVLSASRDYVLYQAVGAIRKPSGEWIPLKATKEIDLAVIEEETLEANLKKSQNVKEENLGNLSRKEWAEQQTKSNMIQWRKNKLMRAETGAMLRVIRGLLSMKMQYSPEELQKPFIVPRVDFSPDYSDPEVKRLMIDHGVKATTELFGAASSQAQGLPPGQVMNQAMGNASNAFAVPDMGQPIDADKFEDEHTDDNYMEAEYTDINEDVPPTLFNGSGNQDPDLKCDDCGTKVTENVANYSLDNYEKMLCVKCQKNHQKVRR